MSGATDLSIRSLPYLDAKWLRADLYGALQNTEDLAVLWNNLIKDNELVTSCSSVGGGTITLVSGVTVNSAGHVSYIGNNGRHYCGADMLLCSCCTGFCRPMSECNCSACHQLDMEEPTKKNASGGHQSLQPSDSILDSWLWGPIPSMLSYIRIDFYVWFNFGFMQLPTKRQPVLNRFYLNNEIYPSRRLAIHCLPST